MDKLEVINEEDFLSKNSNKFILFKLLVEANFFSDKFQYLYETAYIKKTKQSIDNIIKKYKSKNFIISEAFKLKEMNDFNEKIKFLNLNKDFDVDILYDELMKKIEEVIEIKKMIESVQSYINYFFSKNKESIEKINSLSNNLSKIKIYELNNYSKELNEYKKLEKDSKKANEYLKCEFFINIYKNNIKTKNNLNEKELIKDSIDEFNKLIDLLDINTINKIPMKILNIILSSKFSKEKIKKQFEFLKNYFDRNNVNTTEVENLINIFSKKIIT